MIHTAKAHDMAKGKTSTKGTTVLVDRLWPRGISKEDLRERRRDTSIQKPGHGLVRSLVFALRRGSKTRT